MIKQDIIKQALNLERALTAMCEDSRILTYQMDDMEVTRDGGRGYHVYINADTPVCEDGRKGGELNGYEREKKTGA